jgi:hypothetical protein
MKRFMAFLIMVMILFFVNPVYGTETEKEKNWKLTASVWQTMPVSDEGIVQTGIGKQLALHYKSFYIYLSKDESPLRFMGQSGPTLEYWSIGPGVERVIGKHLKLFADFGWYEPSFDRMGELIPGNSDPFSEGLCRYMNKYLAPDTSYPAWDFYSANYQGGIGAKVGLTFEYPLTSWMTLELNASYRYLKFIENVKGKHDPDHPRSPGQDADFWINNYWTIKYDRNFSAYMIGGSISIPF